MGEIGLKKRRETKIKKKLKQKKTNLILLQIIPVAVAALARLKNLPQKAFMPVAAGVPMVSCKIS